MDLEEYRSYLHKQSTPDDAIDTQMSIVGDLVRFLTGPLLKDPPATAGKEDVEQFARLLIAKGRNTLDNFSFLADYAEWLGHRKLYVALLELMDCYSAMEVLADQIEARHGRETRERIFREALPPLGASEKDRCAFTQTILERMAQQLSPEEAHAAWFQIQHGIPAAVWHRSDAANRKKYQQCGDIDEFLNLKRRERDALLTRLRDENKLWYTVVINDEVLEFVRSDPEMEVGQREGDRVYISKIPYNAARYLHTTDPLLRRYYACHCPLVREAILQDQPVSADVCYCSLGHAGHYLAGLGLELKGEVLESAVRGDPRCRFVFYLPNEDGRG